MQRCHFFTGDNKEDDFEGCFLLTHYYLDENPTLLSLGFHVRVLYTLSSDSCQEVIG